MEFKLPSLSDRAGDTALLLVNEVQKTNFAPGRIRVNKHLKYSTDLLFDD